MARDAGLLGAALGRGRPAQLRRALGPGGEPARARGPRPGLLADPKAGRLVGLGAFPEAIDQNPVVYDLAFSLAWRERAPELGPWIHDYAWARYGRDDAGAQAAWRTLLRSVYSQHSGSPGMECPVCARPSLGLDRVDPWGDFERDYDPADVWTAWEQLLSSSAGLGAVDTYRYDLVDVARQGLADLSLPLYAQVVSAYRSGDRPRFDEARSRFMALMADMDALLGTRREFLLGRWLSDARRWGATPAESDLCERNARLLVTVWGPPGPQAFLFDYANREWSGLIRGFYMERWRRFFDFLAAQPPGYSEDDLAKVMNRIGDDASPFYRSLSSWEYLWCDGHEAYAAQPRGDSVAAARAALEAWRPVMRASYPAYPWKRPNLPPGK